MVAKYESGVAWAWAQEVGNIKAKLLLVWLARQCDEGADMVKLDALMREDLGLSEDDVLLALRHLQQRGLLAWELAVAFR